MMRAKAYPGNWSKELQDFTRTMLKEGDFFLLPGDRLGIVMKARDGRFGWISGSDLINERWRIRPLDDEEDWEEEFESIDALHEAGWVVD